LNNLQQAGELIKSFKQVAVDQSSLHQRTFLLKPYLEEVLNNLTPKFKNSPHTLTLVGDESIAMCSYPGAIAQVITNLVVNSLTHAYPDDVSGHLQLTIEPYPDKPESAASKSGGPESDEPESDKPYTDSVVLRYSDDGSGIAADDLGHIFEPFFTTTRDQGGSGLGLHLVYNLVTQKLAGRIQVDSTPNQGTTFTITLPSQIPSQVS
ncbi:MAG: HAMP domain-containing sensor histidine kinase, partial [Cyanobacteria bacterium J06632_3]